MWTEMDVALVVEMWGIDCRRLIDVGNTVFFKG